MKSGKVKKLNALKPIAHEQLNIHHIVGIYSKIHIRFTAKDNLLIAQRYLKNMISIICHMSFS